MSCMLDEPDDFDASAYPIDEEVVPARIRYYEQRIRHLLHIGNVERASQYADKILRRVGK